MTKAPKKSRALDTTSSNENDNRFSSGPHPISKLPIEILCKIFRFTRSAPPNFGSKRFFTPRDFRLVKIDWIAVSRVCQHWRLAAINEPSLWTDLPTFYPKWTMEMLQRSKNAGLVVNFYDTLDDALLTAIFDHILRIAELTVKGEKRLKKLMDKFSLCSTPRLEKLCIENDSHTSSENIPPMRLPNSLFSNAVGLKHLKLIRIDIDWQSHLFSRPLTLLELGQISPSAKPTVKELRSIMQRISTTLQKLTMRNAFPIENHASSRVQSNDPILLLALKRLTLGAKPSEITSFFNNFILSDNTQYADLYMYLENGAGQDFTGMLAAAGRREALGRFVSDAQSVVINGDVVGTKKGNKWQDFELKLSTAEAPLSALREDGPRNHPERQLPGLELNIHGPFSEDLPITPMPFRCVFTDLFNAFKWSNVRELALTGLDIRAYPDFGQVLVTTFGSLPTVELVAVGPKSVNHFLDALSFYSPGSRIPIAFEGLTKISMVSVNIQSRLDEITMSLLRREKRIAPIQKLCFKDCRGKINKYLKMLTELVGEVYWDDVKI
ncbi:hypothetical protein D9619_003545 [Psilocybe cf. subviscida]|uniref:F-box domain-containing protein n=1 Tax=Psilocybe cf. subviscida TaxID=2480587 RepID=A0A8H5ETZ0_9AGAR|nr:hypothetical protein D9619_003545 [Psilocybe cf. subviscida]